MTNNTSFDNIIIMCDAGCGTCRLGKDMHKVEVSGEEIRNLYFGAGVSWRFLCDECYNKLERVDIDKAIKEFKEAKNDFLKTIGAFLYD